MIYVKDVSQGQRYCYVLFFEKKSLSVIVFSRKLSSMYEKKKMKNSEWRRCDADDVSSDVKSNSLWQLSSCRALSWVFPPKSSPNICSMRYVG